MIFRHATIDGRVPSIQDRGLDPAYATGRMRVVWLHMADRTGWAAAKVAKRHGARLADVVVLDVDVQATEVVRHGKGLYYIRGTVPAERIRQARPLSRMHGSEL